MQRARWRISGATWNGEHVTEVSVRHGQMSEAALVEFAAALLDEAMRVRRMRQDRAKFAKEHREGVKRGDPNHV